MRAIKAARESRPGSSMAISSSCPSLHGCSLIPSPPDFRMGYHQTSWENGQSILKTGFQMLDRVQGKGAMLGPGTYFAFTPEDTCGKCMHGHSSAMMLECYVHVGSMDVAQCTRDFRNATNADSVYWRGFKDRPEFVVKDARNIYIVDAYACDPQSGKRLGPIDEGREARLRYATSVWQRERLAAADKFDAQLNRFESALEHIERSKKVKRSGKGIMCKRDRMWLTTIFNRFAGPNGCLNHAELYALLCAVDMAPYDNKADLKATFAEFDRNGNGSVSLKEFLREMKIRAKDGDY